MGRQGSWNFGRACGAAVLWAKFDRETGATMSVAQHSADAGAMAGWLWDEFYGDSVRRGIDKLADGSGRDLYCWLAALHDVGKISFDFSGMLIGAPGADPMLMRQRDDGFDVFVQARPAHPERHELYSHLALREWIAANTSPGAGYARDSLPSVIGSHHGHTVPVPDLNRVSEVVRCDEPAGWAAARQELIDVVTDEMDVRTQVQRWLEATWPLWALVQLNAMVIVADWMASDSKAFPYEARGNSSERLADAVETLALPRRWTASDDAADAAAMIAQRFPGLPGEPNEMQRAFVDVCRAVASPPIVILESPTGSGKTEAALAAAEVLAAQFDASGVYVAMPTMASGNATFRRVKAWISQLPDAREHSVSLAHSKAGLNEEFAGLRMSRPVSVAADAPEGCHVRGGAATDRAQAVVADWFMGRKRHLFATFSVGTVDQVLMAGLIAKHVTLRHLAFSGKVVIVDEVHAADTVQRRFLVQVLGWLARMGVPVILMSATLPPAQRVELLEAYAAGRPRGRRDPARRVVPGLPVAAYPRITVWDGELREVSTKSDARFSREVTLRTLPRRDDALIELLRDKLADGGCVAVIRNTVTRAQQTYDDLRAEFADAVTLLHSRFLSVDRMQREAALVNRLGRGGERPRREIVVATQVIEQSLDLDFDLLVTDLAPVDLVVQRMGRLHRHLLDGDARPQALRAPECWIDAMPRTDTEPDLDKGGVAVYGASLLIRSAATLLPHLGGEVRLPADVPGLVATAYAGDLDVPAAWTSSAELADQRLAQQIAHTTDEVERGQLIRPASQEEESLLGFLNGIVPDEDGAGGGAGRVRDGEDSLEVIVVRRTEEGLRPLAHTSIGDRLLPESEPPDRSLARELAGHTVTFPSWLVLGEHGALVFEQLEAWGLAAWQTSPWLKGQLLLVLDCQAQVTLGNYGVSYDDEVGLTIRRA